MRYIAAGQLITPTDVEQELVTLVNALETGQGELAKLTRQVGDLETRYALDRARALIRSDGHNAAARDAEALLAVAPLFTELSSLRTQQRVLRDRLHDLRAAIDAVRSIGASVRSSMFSDGQGQGVPARPDYER